HPLSLHSFPTRRSSDLCDIYITPYINEAQITSGTLTYAMGSGCVVVSTPYWHAAELLTENKGCLFDFKDNVGLAKVLNGLLDKPDRKSTRLNSSHVKIS